MTRTLMLCRLGLAGAATAVVLTACGGSGGSTTASSSSAARTTSAAPTTAATVAAGGGGAFCDQARNFLTEVQATTDAASPQRLGQALPALANQLGTITPPPAIATDWQQAVSAIQQLAQDFQGVNLSDPQQLAQFEQKLQPLEAQLGTAGSHIEAYLSSQCGIDTGDTASATS